MSSPRLHERKVLPHKHKARYWQHYGDGSVSAMENS